MGLETSSWRWSSVDFMCYFCEIQTVPMQTKCLGLKWSLISCWTLRATWGLVVGRMRPAGRTLCTTGIQHAYDSSLKLYKHYLNLILIFKHWKGCFDYVKVVYLSALYNKWKLTDWLHWHLTCICPIDLLLNSEECWWHSSECLQSGGQTYQWSHHLVIIWPRCSGIHVVEELTKLASTYSATLIAYLNDNQISFRFQNNSLEC